MAYRAYEGANGWYVAWEQEDGFHHQPTEGGHMTQRAACQEAAARNRRETLTPAEQSAEDEAYWEMRDAEDGIAY